MWIEVLFICSATIIFTGMFKLIGLILGNSMSLPKIIPFTDIDPTHYRVWYPSVLFQVWFWIHHFELF